MVSHWIAMRSMALHHQAGDDESEISRGMVGCWISRWESNYRLLREISSVGDELH